jgi:hypothetical protein
VLGGTVAGLAFLPLLLALRLALRSVLTPELRALPQLPDALYIWTLIVALGLQAVVSAVVAARVTDLVVAHALLAASIAGFLAAVGALGATAIASCAPIFAVRVDPAGCGAVQLEVSDLHSVVQFMIGGALLAIPAAAAVHIVRTASDRSRTIEA